MKTERQIAEQIFQLFRNQNCSYNQGYVINVLTNQVVFKLNPKERELFDIVFLGLQALKYISVDQDGFFVRLTKKGFDYIYDDNIVERMQKIPWVIPELKNTNWIVAWNKLWKVINESPYYYSGPMFMELICELDNSIESDYYRYMEFRRAAGMSTSRKDYFRDLINGLPEDIRYEFYVRMQNALEEKVFLYDNENNHGIDSNIDLISNEYTEPIKDDTIKDDTSKDIHPKVFISYSWDSEEHIKWVLELATKLCENGIDVILDQWELSHKGGSLIPDFMVNAVSSAERVLCIMTPNYKLKTDKLNGGVGVEYSILSSELVENLQTTKFIPILRLGDEHQSTPILLNKRICYFMRDEDNFEDAFTDLLRDLYNEPKIVKPALGKKPRFK